MDSRICSKCGWEFPLTYKAIRCKWCGTFLTTGECRVCHKTVDNLVPGYNMCRECLREREKIKHHNLYHRRAGEAKDRYDAWLKRAAALPHEPLTEEQWLKTVMYFDGCALCENERVDARSYFIQYKNGGRYTAWNVIPLCEECATRMNQDKNPFILFDRRLYVKRPNDRNRRITHERINYVAAYLAERMEEVESRQKTDSVQELRK